MTILLIHGSPRPNGCSSNIARDIASKMKADKILEINLQKENLPYCVGCLNCVKKGIEFCPHKDQTVEMEEKMLEADLIIISTPVYILHMSGQLKTFIDHFPSLFLMHRPQKAMFNKSLIIVATAAGPVYKQTLKEIEMSFIQFGISKIYKLGFAVAAQSYKDISEKKLKEINKECDKTIKKVKKNFNKNKVKMKIKFYFFIYRMVQKRTPTSEADTKYWKKYDWYNKGRPWK